MVHLFICAPSKAITNQQTPSNGWKPMGCLYDWYMFINITWYPPKETLIISQQFMVVRTYTNQSLPGCITWLEHPLEASLTKRSNRRDEGIWGFIVIGEYMRILCVNLQQMLAKVSILQRIKPWSITQCPSGVRNSTCAPCRAITDQTGLIDEMKACGAFMGLRHMFMNITRCSQ